MRRVAGKVVRRLKHILHKILMIPRLAVAITRLLFSRLTTSKDTPKAVGLLVDSFGRGGLEQVVLNLYRGYRESGHPAYVISVTNQVSDMIQGIEDDPRHLRILHWNLVDLINFCRKNNIRTLHYHYSIYHMPLMRMLGIRTIYTIHNTYVWFSKAAWLKTSFYLRFCTHIVAVSEFARDYFIEKSKIRRVITILNGIDINHFLSAHNHVKTPTRQSLGLSEDDKVFVNVASFNEQKYQLSLVGALEKIIKKRQDIKVVFVGPIGDKKLYKHIVKVIEKSPAKDSIRVLDPLTQAQLVKFLRTVPDAFILPSIYEAGVPLVVSEAILCGLPVAMTDLHTHTFPLAEFITTIQPPYDDLADLTIADVVKMVRQKKSRNQDDIIEKMLYVADNLDTLKPEVDQDKVAKALGIDQMTSQYIKLIEQ